jgi:hypothetical protein
MRIVSARLTIVVAWPVSPPTHPNNNDQRDQCDINQKLLFWSLRALCYIPHLTELPRPRHSQCHRSFGGKAMTAMLIPIAAIIVSIVVAVVQYAQWRTANQKVVIDLYDRRLKVYQQLEKAISPVLRDGEVNGAAFNEFMIGQADATFLFGEDVQEYLKSLRKCFAWLLSMRNEVIENSPKRAESIDTKFKYIAEIVAFYKTAPDCSHPT